MNIVIYNKQLNEFFKRIVQLQISDGETYPEVKITSENDLKAFLEMEQAFNFVIGKINDLVLNTQLQGWVNFQTGLGLVTMRPIKLNSIKFSDSDLVVQQTFHRMHQKLNEIQAMYNDYGVQKEE
ncbi:hypothetical protein LIX87_01220 [Weissella viridescens]|uniref:hypothetical protein n=1 Tax=Weissella viridescens TaxID=1629 RepID=UPI001D068F45|nr:hypothetical protein [Weissella viridescens]MCB6839638.1 hypothetical protein [Weissella viridescens]MCB6846369.1 hypothetical protein [Weissella viridescens]